MAFAKKFVEEEMDEKVKEQAEFEELTLDFKTYVELAKSLCQTSSQLFTNDTIKLASSSGEELQVRGAFDIWIKLSEEVQAQDRGPGRRWH